MGCIHTRDHVSRIKCVVILDEAKAVHELDLRDVTRSFLEVALDVFLCDCRPDMVVSRIQNISSVASSRSGLPSRILRPEIEGPTVTPGLSDSKVSPVTRMAYRPRGKNTRSWNVLLHTITRKIS